MSPFGILCMIIVFACFTFIMISIDNTYEKEQAVIRKKYREQKSLRRTFHMLGLKVPKELDGYAREAYSQFQKECSRNSISVNYNLMPDLFAYLRVLAMKGKHLELVKDDKYVQYNPKEDEYLGTIDWQKKWNKIIFSSVITKDNFIKCIRTIMDAHNITNQLESIYGVKIEEDSCYFIFRILHVMNYKMLVKENSSALSDYEICKPSDFKEKQPYPQSNDHYLKLLYDLVAIKMGYEVKAPDIRIEGNYREIIFLNNIVSDKPDLMATSGMEVDKGNIVLGLKAPFDIKIWNRESVIANNVIGIEVINDMINYEYLYLLLKLECHKLRINRISEIDVRSLKEMEIVVVPSIVQHEIIERCRPFWEDEEWIKNVFRSYEEEYPLLGLISKTIVGSL